MPAAGATTPARTAGNSNLFRRAEFSDLPGWNDDDPRAALAAFARSAAHAASKPYRRGELGAPCESFADAFDDVRRMGAVDAGAARAFFESRFVPFRVEPAPAETGFVTAYYEPEVEASRERAPGFDVPLYRQPDDLVVVDDDNRPPGMDPTIAFARRTGTGIVPYHDRGAIERGALAGRGLEIAWLSNRVDAFFIHVQGAARLQLIDGSRMRVTYAAKSGHPFTGPGRVLVGLGEIPAAAVTMQAVRAWLKANPHRAERILWRNRSFIFFRETPLGDAAKGPVAAAKVQLEAGRSLAVDRLLHTFATPFFIDVPSLTAFDAEPFRRLMIAQDTGSAITGRARGDIFAGTGSAAGEVAGGARHAADFYALLPRRFAERLA